jgi:hypothetical protein
MSTGGEVRRSEISYLQRFERSEALERLERFNFGFGAASTHPTFVFALQSCRESIHRN